MVAQDPFGSQIELRGATDDSSSDVEASKESRLPRTDGGRAAWSFLAGSFLIEVGLWAFPYSFGVLKDYYSIHLPIAENSHGISAVGTTCSGIMYMAAPFSFAAFQRWPRFGNTGLFYGLPIVAIAVFLSSYSTQVWHLLLTQGIMYPLGGAMLYFPIFNFIDEWFVLRKGFAYGVMWGGSGVGGLCGPLLLQWGLKKYGVEIMLRGWAVALIILIGPMLFFVKPRMPVSHYDVVSLQTIKRGFGFIRIKPFWIFCFGACLQALGYFIPILYLPTYSRLNEAVSGSLLVSLLNVASVPGILFHSSLTDIISVYTVILLASVGTALAVFVLWGLSASSTALLITFSLSFGFFAGGFTGIYAGIATELRRATPDGDKGRANIGSIFGLLTVARGTGSLMCGPLSESLLLSGSGAAVGTAGSYASEFGPLIVFSGTAAVVVSLCWVAKILRIV